MARLGRTGVYQRFVPIHLEELADDTARLDTAKCGPALNVKHLDKRIEVTKKQAGGSQARVVVE